MLAVRGGSSCQFCPRMPCVGGSGGPTACRVESVARWHGGCCQPSLARVLKLASAHRTLQPQECNSRPLPWQSRHSQTGRMCGGRRGEGLRLRLRWCDVGVGFLCVCVLWTAAWVMLGVRMSVHSVICQSLFNRMPCLEAYRLNTHNAHTACPPLPPTL